MRASKKSRFASERNEETRAEFRRQIEVIECHKLVFLDECGFALNLHRLYGWVVGGGRCVEAVPFNKGVNRSVVGAYSFPTQANPTGLWALWQKLGAWTGLLFAMFLEEAVLPQVPRGSVLVLDNASIHRGANLEPIVARAGCSLLYLPPYSPDYNPIELVWSWIKARVRALAPREDAKREACIQQAHRELPPQAAPGWFRHCGLPFSD